MTTTSASLGPMLGPFPMLTLAMQEANINQQDSVARGRNLEQNQAHVGPPADGWLGKEGGSRTGVRAEGREELTHTAYSILASTYLLQF